MAEIAPLHATVVQPVAGFTFQAGGADGAFWEPEHSEKSGFICQIIGRVPPEDEGLEPKFKVQFGDGETLSVWAKELTPWYPT